jgi:hypothetical protein
MILSEAERKVRERAAGAVRLLTTEEATLVKDAPMTTDSSDEVNEEISDDDVKYADDLELELRGEDRFDLTSGGGGTRLR